MALDTNNSDIVSTMTINRHLSLMLNQFYKKIHEKNLITLHHTVGGSAKSTFDYWNKSKSRVGTAYIIERDGTIYEVFSPEYWAGHHGVRGDRNNLDKRSIGIELCNYGPLKEKNSNIVNSYGTAYNGAIYVNPTYYRHSNMFEEYSYKQIQALCWLVNDLLTRFPSIPRDTPLSKETDYNRFKNYKGIIGHFHVRPDKSDPHPGFDWGMLTKKCRLRYD